jgi:hypothetical protein
VSDRRAPQIVLYKNVRRRKKMILKKPGKIISKARKNKHENYRKTFTLPNG